jgi:hypothetical protein
MKDEDKVTLDEVYVDPAPKSRAKPEPTRRVQTVELPEQSARRKGEHVARSAMTDVEHIPQARTATEETFSLDITYTKHDPAVVHVPVDPPRSTRTLREPARSVPERIETLLDGISEDVFTVEYAPTPQHREQVVSIPVVVRAPHATDHSRDNAKQKPFHTDEDGGRSAPMTTVEPS